MRLKEYLKKVKLTSKDFAEFMGIHRKYLSEIITGKCLPSEKLAKKISDATAGKVSVDELYPEGYNRKCPCCGQRIKRKKP